jgi:hypothetical protein
VWQLCVSSPSNDIGVVAHSVEFIGFGVKATTGRLKAFCLNRMLSVNYLDLNCLLYY